MSRFKVIKSKGRFYVVTTDSNGLAGGPYESPEEADQRAANLAALEVKQAAVLAERVKNERRMNITPGYRSPDVEDGRSAPQPIVSSWAPDWWQNPPKMGDGPTRAPGRIPPWNKHRIPTEGDPVYTPPDTPTAPPYNLRNLGTPGGMFDMTPGSTGFAPSVPGAGGPFDWKLDADQAELAKRQTPPWSTGKPTS